MPKPVNFTSTAATSSVQNPPHSTARSPMAEQFAGMSNPPLTGSIPFSRQSPPSPHSIAGRTAAGRSSATAANTKAKTQVKQRFQALSDLYNTNYGAKAINTAIRGGEVRVDVGEVMNEIEERSSIEEILTLKKNGFVIRSNVKFMLDEQSRVDIKQLQLIADEMYQPADPSNASPRMVHRGQGMTQAGVNQLIRLWKKGTPVQATHFLSCDKSLAVAKAFAGRHTPGIERAVVIQIRGGFSNVALRPNTKVVGESETLFSPHATFLIENMGENPDTGNVVVHLREIAKTGEAVPFPY